MLEREDGVILSRSRNQHERRVHFTPDLGATLIDWEHRDIGGWIEVRRFKLSCQDLNALWFEMKRLLETVSHRPVP